MQGSIPWQEATVANINRSTPRVKSFVLALQRPFQFLAGQHVDVRLTAPDGYRAMRSYSIASAPAPFPVSHIEIVVELLPNGEVSPFFHDVVSVGDAIELRGPLGQHFVLPETKSSVLLLGGGSGVVPLMSMVRYAQAAAPSDRMVLFQSARRWDDVLFRDELVAFDGSRADFSFVLTLTREAPRRPMDLSGRIDRKVALDLLSRFVGEPSDVFICGSNPFVNAASDGIVDAGVSPSIIKTERYGG